MLEDFHRSRRLSIIFSPKGCCMDMICARWLCVELRKRSYKVPIVEGYIYSCKYHYEPKMIGMEETAIEETR
jgi:hypothetical protein